MPTSKYNSVDELPDLSGPVTHVNSKTKKITTYNSVDELPDLKKKDNGGDGLNTVTTETSPSKSTSSLGEVGKALATGQAANSNGVPVTNTKTKVDETNNDLLHPFDNPLKEKIISTPDGVSFNLSSTSPIAVDDKYVQGLQQRINTNTTTPEDIQAIAISTDKTPQAVDAYLNKGKQIGFATDNVDKEKRLNDDLTDTINTFNTQFGTTYDPTDVLLSADKTAKFLQDYQNKVAQKNANQIGAEFQKTAADAVARGYDDTDALDVKSIALQKTKEQVDALKGQLARHQQLLDTHIVNTSIIEDAQNGVPKDETIIKIANRINPKGVKESNLATVGAAEQAVNATHNPIASLGIAYDMIFGTKDKDELLSAVKGEAELRYNNGLQNIGLSEISKGILNNDANLIKSGKQKLDEVDNNAIYKYPTLVKQEIARRVSETIARESGQIEGRDTENLSEKIQGASDFERARVMKELGYLDDPKTKDIAASMLGHDEYFADASYLGGVKNSFLQPFKELGMSIGDITKFRNTRDLLSDKKQTEMFPAELQNTKADFSLPIIGEVRVRNVLNTTANLTGMAAIAIGTEGIGSELGLTANATKSLAAYTSFGLPSYDAALKDSYNFLDNDAARTLYATITAVTNAEGGRLLDLGKIVRIPGVSEVYAKMAKGLTENTLAKEGVQQLLGEAKNPYIDFAVKYGKNVTKGAATMAYFNITNNIERLAFGDPLIHADDLLPQAGTAFLDGVTGMSIMGAFGAVADMRNEKNTSYKGFIYNMALNHDSVEDVFKQGLKDGTYTPTEYNQKMQILNTSVAAKKAMDAAQIETNTLLNENQKSVYVANKTAAAVLRDKLEKTPPENEEQKNIYKNQIEKLDTQNKDVLAGLQFSPTLEPLYDLYDAEKKYNAAEETGNYDAIEAAKKNYDDLIHEYLTKKYEVKPITSTEPIRAAEGQVSQSESVATNQSEAQVAENAKNKNTQDLIQPNEITVGEMIDKSGSYKGERGQFSQDGQTVLFKVDGKNKEYELGNVNEIKDSPISSYGITHEQSVVNVNDAGNIEVRGNEYVNNYSDPKAAVNYDKEGNVVSVNLETADGKKRTFRGNIAEDIAYQIHLKEITKDNENTTKFEDFINTPDVAKTINEGLPKNTEATPTGNNDQVQQPERTKVEPVSEQAQIINSLVNNDKVPPFELKAMQDNPELALKSIADQALGFGRDAEGNRQPLHETANEPQLEATERKFGKEVVAKAIELYPDETKPAEATTPKLTKEAEDLLASIKEGSQPTFITKNLEKIAKDNGIEITDKMTANDVIDKLKEKQNISSSSTDNKSTIYSKEKTKEEKPPVSNQEPPKPKEEGADGVKISKAGLKGQYNFSKDFDERGGAVVATSVLHDLKNKSEAEGITLEKHIANEVEAMKGNVNAPTEYNIITAGAHLLNVDKLIKDGLSSGENIDSLITEREQTAAVLRQLGNSAGRNLGLFNLVFKDVSNSEISIARDTLKKTLGIEDLPDNIEALNKSDLSNFDKKKAEPYVKKIEQLIKEKEAYEKQSVAGITTLNEKEVQDAIKAAHEAGKKEGIASVKYKPAKEKKSQQLKDFASKLRTSDEMDKFLDNPGNINIQKNGIDIGSYKEIIANILDGVAKVIEKGEDVADYIKKSIDKIKDVDKAQLSRDVQMIISRSSLRNKDEVIGDINKISKNEDTTTITKSMVDKGLIKNVVDDIIHSDIPYDKVIDYATQELKKYLPDVTKEEVTDAYVRRNSFSLDSKAKLDETIKNKTADVRRLTNKEGTLAALEAGDDFNGADTPEKKKQIKSDYEKQVDTRIADLNKQKTDLKNSDSKNLVNADRLQKAKDTVEKNIESIREEIANKERKLEKEKLPLHEDVELGRLKEVEDALTELRDKYLPKEPEKFADEKALKKRRVDLTNEISELNDQINSGKRKINDKVEVADTDYIKTLRQIKEQKQSLLDEVAPDYEKIKRQQEAKAQEVAKKITDIDTEIAHVKNSKTVFEQAIKNPNKANELLKAARAERDKVYQDNGFRIERNSKQPIKIEQEYQKALKDVEENDSLSEKEKTDKLAELKAQRDLDLNGTQQGVISNLSDDLSSFKKENIGKANNADDATAKKLTDLNKSLDELNDGLKASGENLEDVANKAYEKINELIKDKSIPKESRDRLKEIKKDFENNNQKTADELANQSIKKRFQSEIDAANTKKNSGNFTELPVTPYDFRRSTELSNLNRQRQNTTKQLNNLVLAAKEKNRTGLDKALDLSTKLLVSGTHTVLKVAEAAGFKPVADSIVDATTGRIFNKLTDTPKTTLDTIKKGFKTLGAFKNKEAAENYIKKLANEKLSALEKLKEVQDSGDASAIKKAQKDFEKADLAYGISTLYHSIDANSLKTFWEYLAHGATDLDEQIGKSLKKNISDYRTKLGKVGYVVEGWIRSHGALKTSISARNEIMRSYASTLEYFQKTGKPLDEEHLALAHLLAVNDYEAGRLSNQTQFSKFINRYKNHDNVGVRAATKVLAPVSTIAINIAKRGIDYSTLGAEGWVRLASEAKKGMRINEVEGKTYDTWVQKVKDGIKTIPLQERKYINGVISRGLFGVGLSLITAYGLASGNIKYGGTWDDRKKRSVRDSNGNRLDPGEWEFFGWKAPKIMNAFINHLPEFLPVSLTADTYQIHQLDKDGGSVGNYIKTVASEIQERFPFMTLAGLFNDPAKTLVDRFTRVPVAQDVESLFDDTAREHKTLGEKLKRNLGLDFLNPKDAGSYSKEELSAPEFKPFLDKGMTLPQTNPNDVKIKNEKNKTEKKLSEYGDDKIKEYSEGKKKAIHDELKAINSRGYVYVDEYGNAHINEPNKGKSKKTKISDLSNDNLRKILSEVGTKASEKSKSIIEHSLKK